MTAELERQAVVTSGNERGTEDDKRTGGEQGAADEASAVAEYQRTMDALLESDLHFKEEDLVANHASEYVASAIQKLISDDTVVRKSGDKVEVVKVQAKQDGDVEVLDYISGLLPESTMPVAKVLAPMMIEEKVDDIFSAVHRPCREIFFLGRGSDVGVCDALKRTKKMSDKYASYVPDTDIDLMFVGRGKDFYAVETEDMAKKLSHVQKVAYIIDCFRVLTNQFYFWNPTLYLYKHVIRKANKICPISSERIMLLSRVLSQIIYNQNQFAGRADMLYLIVTNNRFIDCLNKIDNIGPENISSDDPAIRDAVDILNDGAKICCAFLVNVKQSMTDYEKLATASPLADEHVLDSFSKAIALMSR